jgi:short-subunit dehydrogenase
MDQKTSLIMKNKQPRRIWLVGATSGIGLKLAEKLAKQGNMVIISGRNEDVLNNLYQSNPKYFFPLAVDATKFEEVQMAAQKIEAEFGGLDTLFYNAGNCIYIDTKAFQHKAFEKVFQINYMGFVYTIEASLPLLRKGNQPYLVGMSSSSAFVGLPRAEAYGSSKAAVQYLLDSLRVDLAEEGIDVSAVYPGFVKTPLTDLNDFPMPFLISPDKAVDYILKGMARRGHHIHFPKRFTMLLKILGNLPSKLKTKIVRKMVRT